MDNRSVSADILFETSWEVCNKVGGIYTVLSTKAKSLQEKFKNNLIFIGPDVWTKDNPSPFFKESKTLLKGWTANTGLPAGVTVRVGRWDIPGQPIVVLVSFEALYSLKNELYGEMWNRFGVDSLHAYGDYDEACAFSYAAGLVIESLCNYKKIAGKNVVAQFNEWTTGMGLLYVKWKLPRVATVFTTHATSIGRSICSNGKPLYDYMTGYNGDQMARELNMESKHSLEKAAAHQADCFTTVSDVTADECAQLLERRPDVVTPNGFEPGFVPTAKVMPAARRAARERILEVAGKLIGTRLPSNTAIIATSGRCEYRNKGIDLFLDSINELRATAFDRRILALVLVPAWSGQARKDLVEAVKNEGRYDMLPDPVITHELHNYDSDPILARIHQLNFNHIPSDNITLIYIPCYLNGNDGVVNLDYYKLLPGLDATVFPSYYEPWGYTPLESVAFGIPTLTTTLAGFGQWVLTAIGDSLKQTGVKVVKRTDNNYHEVVKEIADTLAAIIHGQPAHTTLQKAARLTASKADWEHFIGLYLQSFAIAINNCQKRN